MSKPHPYWENSLSQVICQKALVQSDCRILSLSVSLEGLLHIFDFLHFDIHLGKVASETADLGWVCSGIDSHCMLLSCHVRDMSCTYVIIMSATGFEPITT